MCVWGGMVDVSKTGPGSGSGDGKGEKGDQLTTAPPPIGLTKAAEIIWRAPAPDPCLRYTASAELLDYGLIRWRGPGG